MKKLTAIILSLGFLAISLAPVQARMISVHGYYRSNGTYVQPYTRSSPGTGTLVKISTPEKPLYYTNISGNKVERPTTYSSTPAGASAKCRDGTYSFSQHVRGTCSYHGGVGQWIR